MKTRSLLGLLPLLVASACALGPFGSDLREDAPTTTRRHVLEARARLEPEEPLDDEEEGQDGERPREEEEISFVEESVREAPAASAAPTGEDLDGFGPVTADIGPATLPAATVALRLVEEARERIASGQTAQAQESLERAVAMDGQSTPAWHFLALLHLRAGRLPEADALSARAVAASSAADPSWQDRVLLLRGEVLEAMDLPGEARQAYEAVLRRDPTHEGARTRMARLPSE